jgi:GMP synthase-like glutamine amidotransferase
VAAVRTLIVANRSEADAGFVGEALVARDATLEFLLREDDWPLPTPDTYDVVVSLGSEWSVYWEHLAPAVGREVTLLQQAVEAGKPVLGLCFGGQILAHALGGSVGPAPAPELGWHTIASDRPEQLPEGPYVQWHSDRFEVPPGAVELARNAAGPQAYALGSALGLQFHPEATPEVVRRWCVGGLEELARGGVDPVGFIAEAEERADEARARADQIVGSFQSGALVPGGTPSTTGSPTGR